jgi:tellurite methyltransferase
MDEPFWEQTYRDPGVSTFAKGPTSDLAQFCGLISPRSSVLDVGCGEGRNAIFLAGQGHDVDAFDLSQAGVAKAQGIAAREGVRVRFWAQDLADFQFGKDYDVILSHGVLHLPEKLVRDAFIARAQARTRPGGLHFIGVFTNRRPATPDNAPFTRSLFDVGELPAKYAGWEIVHHLEDIFQDQHPGGLRHEHAYERVIARKKPRAKRRIYLSDGTVALAEYIEDEDDPALYACRCDPGTERGFNMRQTRTFEAYCSWEGPPGWGAIILRLCDETPIGSIGFVSENADLSIMLYPQYRGMGYGARAFALGTRYCGETLKLERVYAGCYPDNHASQKMLAACGFARHPEGDMPERQYLTGEEITQLDFVKDLR